jgi:uncharacterized SAM-binding protein YcdF (DUF218 family)
MVRKTGEVEKLAKIIWDYHLMHHKLQKADLILILGGSHIQVAKYGATLFLEGWAPLIMVSGGLGKNAKKLWGKTEAEAFREVLIDQGVPKNKIIMEKESLNTGENVINSKKILINKGLVPKKIIAVHKPFMERRTYATIKNFWPEVEVVVSSPNVSFENYEIEGKNREYLINSLVGYLHRIKEYPKMGFQVEQEIPKKVWNAYNRLVQLGYSRKLIKFI